jgi:hypothetical protein
VGQIWTAGPSGKWTLWLVHWAKRGELGPGLLAPRADQGCDGPHMRSRADDKGSTEVAWLTAVGATEHGAWVARRGEARQQHGEAACDTGGRRMGGLTDEEENVRQQSMGGGGRRGSGFGGLGSAMGNNSVAVELGDNN